MDYAGATPVLTCAVHAMERASRLCGNPSAIHSDGLNAKAALDGARRTLAQHLGCRAREVLFTSGATEANNLAIIGYVRHLIQGGRLPKDIHCVTSAIEHPSVLACFGELERIGCAVSYVAPDHRGIIGAKTVASSLTPTTALVSVGWANSETGAIQPIHAIAQELRLHESVHNIRIVFHSDAGQAPLYLHTRIHGLGVDMLTLDSGKLYGPRGIGALFLSRQITLAPLLFGGGQERQVRPGTEPVMLAVGFAKSYAYCVHEREKESVRLRALSDTLITLIEENIPGVIINTPRSHALPHIVHVSLPGEYTGEYITLALDAAGFSVSTKSACREGEGSVSHVIEAFGGELWRARNTVRVSLGNASTATDVRRFVRELKNICRPRTG